MEEYLLLYVDLCKCRNMAYLLEKPFEFYSAVKRSHYIIFL